MINCKWGKNWGITPRFLQASTAGDSKNFIIKLVSCCPAVAAGRVIAVRVNSDVESSIRVCLP